MVSVFKEKVLVGGFQVGIRKTNESEPLCGSVEMLGWHQNRGLRAPRGEPGGGSCCWPVDVRREGGMSPVCCVCVKQEKVH